MRPITSLSRLVSLATVALAAASFGSSALAATVWNEEEQGDFTDDRLAPTAVAMALGSNVVIGTTGSGDRDYFTFVVPQGAILRAVVVQPNTSVSGSVSFFAIARGNQVLTTPTGEGLEALLGFGHYGTDSIGADLLDAIVPAGQRPLTSGAYSIWVQETGGPVSYGFDFQITAVPEPGSALLWAAGLGAFALRPRRR